MSLRVTVKSTWPVLLAYGLFTLWGIGCIVASVLLRGRFGGSDMAALLGIVIASIAGHVLGNLLGLARLRLAFVVVAFVAAIVAASLLTAALGPFGVYLFIGLVAVLGGYLGVASRLDVVAAWFPLTLAVGGAVSWMNHLGKVSVFNRGDKYALWDPFTLLCLGGAVFLMLVFLATRNALSLSAWQATSGKESGDGERLAPTRPGRGSFLVLFLVTALVLGVTAAVSPYLFRTRPAEKGETTKQHDGKGDGQDGQGDGDGDGDGQGGKGGKGGKGSKGGKGAKGGKKGGKGSKGGKGGGQGQGGSSGSDDGSGSGSGSSGQGDRDGQGGGGDDDEGDDGAEGEGDGEDGKPSAKGAAKRGAQALSASLDLLFYFLIFLLALLVLAFILFPPVRRAVLLSHLETPRWPVAPTDRVANLWRRATEALAELDIVAESGETPVDFATRAAREVAPMGVDGTGLVAAAQILSKVDYAGRGLGPGEEDAMRRAVMAFVRALASHVPFGKKLAAGWGRPPEVES